MLPRAHYTVTHPSDQNAPVLTSEQANALFSVENYGAYTADALHGANLENFRESKHLHGKFTAHLYDRVLPAINESIKRLKDGDEINGFSGERKVGAYLESIGYTADLVRQWNKRYRDRMAKLKKTLGLTAGNGDAKLTPEQLELCDTLIQQGYKNTEATWLAKAAEGNSVSERFNWVMAHRAKQINRTTVPNEGVTDTAAVESKSEPATEATEPSTATEPGGVTTVTGADATDETNPSEPVASEPEAEVTQAQPLPLTPTAAADQLKVALAEEPDRDVASKMLTEHLRACANQFATDRIGIKDVSATLIFIGRDHRIVPGDWLEKRDEDAAPTLCKCVGIAQFSRRRVQEWDGDQWGKEHVVFSDHERTYRVITEEIARKLAPDAFDLSFGPQPEPAPAPIEQREKPPEQQDGSDLKHDCLNLTAFPDEEPEPHEI